MNINEYVRICNVSKAYLLAYLLFQDLVSSKNTINQANVL